MLIKVYIKYNDGQWRGQNFPHDHTRDETQEAIEVFDLLTRFKEQDFIQDFKVKLVKYDIDGKRFEFDLADLIQQTNEQL